MTSTATIIIDETRLARVTKLYIGNHDEGSDEMCIMEAISFVTHKKWSDHPPCVCPVLGAFMRSWNDCLPDDERTSLLLSFIPKMIKTRGSEAIEQRRATMAVDWLIRVHTPAWLRLAKLDKQAELLASLPEITDFAQYPSLMPTLTAVKQNAAAARAAARDAAGEAAVGAAAWAAGGAAAWAAVGAAGGAAGEAAVGAAAWVVGGAAVGAAAWAAVGAAAWAAGWAAVDAGGGAAVNKTRKELQVSAVQLVERMIALTDSDKLRL